MPVKLHRATAREFVQEVLGPGEFAVVEQSIIRDLPPEHHEAAYRDIAKTFKEGKPSPYHTEPVDIEVFLRDKYFLGMGDELYPESLPYLREINSGKYVEAVLTGGIGSGKTTNAVLTQAYQLFLLSLMRDPHATFGLERASEIEIIFQSLTAGLASGVDYARFKALIERSPYFEKHFPFNPELKSELHFPNRIIVKPVSGLSTATIGQNVISALIDELNYMAVIDKSSRTHDSGSYNQAIEIYNSISRRRKSRFLTQGKLPGVLCLVSSKKYPGQFTDIKTVEALTDPTIYIYDKRVWDLKPKDFSQIKFRVFIGDEFRKPRILNVGEELPEADADKITEVPEDFRVDFERDIVNSLREIAGISHLSKFPFFTDPDPLNAMFKKENSSVFSLESTDLITTKLQLVGGSIRNPEALRYAHIDLAVSGDSAGIAVGHVDKFVNVDRGGFSEPMPNIVFDGVIEIVPPKGGEILFWKIRKIIFLLRDRFQMDIRWVSFDTFQSVDSMQLLRQQGFVVGPVSMDKDMVPYDFFKSAVYDQRVQCHPHAKLYRELRNLQIDMKKKKVDHLPTESKDIADACAGVAYGLTIRREIWSAHGVQISRQLVELAKRSDEKMKSE